MSPAPSERWEPVPASGTVAVVGASLAGLTACEVLRGGGFAGRIVLLGEEDVLPYDRPPLSKQFLAGEWGTGRLWLRSRERVDRLELDLRLGVRAVGLDLSRRLVAVDDGTAVAFDGLVVATGARPRPWPAHGPLPEGVLTLRTIGDSSALRAQLVPDARLVVVGGGFLGCEVAATARRLGREVTIVEPLATPLGRSFPPEIGDAVRELHEEHGVVLRTATGVAGFVGEGRLAGVRLADGEVLAADVAVVAIGVEPATGWLEDSGLVVDDGVVCDASLRAAPGVVVAGDVARFPHPLVESPVRVEHWTNASEQGAHAARTLLRTASDVTDFVTVPYVWSDQHGKRIEALGLPGPRDEVVVSGSVEAGGLVACCGRDGRLVGLVGIGASRKLAALRPLLATGASLLDGAVALR